MAKILIALYVLTTSAALIVLKWGSKNGALAQFTDHKLHVNINPYVVAGIVLYGTSFLIYTYLISRYDLGYIIPLTTAFVYAAIFTASFFVFGEVFTVMKVTGILLVVAGVIFLNFKG